MAADSDFDIAHMKTPLRGAIDGYGFIMEKGHAAGYLHRDSVGGDVQIVAVADVSEERRELARKQLPGVRVYPDHAAGPIDDFYGAFRTPANGWRGIRSSGFGLALQWQPLEPVGAYLESLSSRTALVTGTDGLVTAAALGSPDFLGWAQHKNVDCAHLSSVTVNPYPLVEFFFEAIRFVYGVVSPALKSTMWKIRVLGMHLQDRVPLAVQLQAGDFVLSRPTPSTANTVDTTIDGTGNWDTDAFRVLEALLGQGFGVGRRNIPFARNGTVNPETFNK